MPKGSRKERAVYGAARNGAILGALIGLFAIIVCALLMALSPEFRRERPDLSISVLAVTYLAGGVIGGAAAGALRVFWKGLFGKMAIGVLLTAVGYIGTYPLINREPFVLDGEHLFGLVFTSLILGALIGLTSMGGNKSE